jgi:superfamily I DNA/RNA helicase
MKFAAVGPKKKFIVTPKHKVIFDAITSGDRNVMIMAVAGSGKTSTIVEAMGMLEGKTVLSLAFNKNIADEMSTRVPSHVEAMTLHSLGMRALTEHMKAQGVKLKVDADKVRAIAKEEMTVEAFRLYGSKAVKMVSLAKSAGMSTVGITMPHEWEALAAKHDVMDDVKKPEKVYEWAEKLLRLSCEKQHVIDFDDMLLLCYALECPMPRFDFVFVDEAQDLSPLQHEMLARVAAHPGSRVVAVGDPHQAIYGFRGADSESMDKLRKRFDCTVLPLDVSHRCPQAVIRFAQEYVHHIQALPDAPEGTVVREPKPLTQMGPTIGDMVLCRTTAPVVRGAYSCIRAGIPAVVLGRDIGKGLLTLVKNLKPRDLEELKSKVDHWQEVESAKAAKKGDEAKQAAVDDKAESLRVFMDMATSLDHMREIIESMFSDASAESVVTFSTIHKAKGLEASRVFILDFHKQPSKWAKQEWQKEQERNLIYVAITRCGFKRGDDASGCLFLALSEEDWKVTALHKKTQPGSSSAATTPSEVPVEKWPVVSGNTYPVR